MSTLSVIVAPRGPASGVLDVLQDYSALGLVEPFLWIDPAGVTPARVAAREVRGGRQYGTTLQDALSSGQRARVRVCVLVPKLEDAPTVPHEIEQRVAELAQATSGGASVDRIRCVLTRPDSGHGTGDLAREGWHNLLVAPEDSRGPGRAHSLLEPSTAPLEIGRHAAPVVAAVLGLWTDADVAPLDDAQVLPGRTVREVRSFYRRLDASAVEQRLRSAVFATTSGTPLPREHGQAATHVEDVALATGTMATALWTKHASVLHGPRVQPSREPVKMVGPLDALKMLFGFLAASIRNAPAQWYAGMVNRVASSAARAVQGAVFGSAPAAFAVVVNGVSSTGFPAGWEDLAEAGSRLDDALATPGEPRTHEATAGLAGVWRDFTVGAMTLADGGQRDATLPAVQVGATRGVLRDVADCVPAADKDFTDIPGYVAASVGISRVEAADVLGAQDLAERLEHLSQDPAVALEVDRTRHALAAWRHERQRSYSAQVGGILGKRLLDVSAEIRHLVGALATAAQAQEPDAASRARQRRLARLMKVLLAAFSVVALGGVVLGGLSIISWTVAAVVAVASAIVWLVTSLLVFMNQQRDLFRELNRRREAIAQVEAMRTNLRQALRDQRRLASAYRQFLAWSGVLGALLRTPFGEAPASAAVAPALGDGLPLAARLGEVVVDEPVLADAAALLRRDVFTTGWLTAPFEAAVNDIGRRLGPEAYELRENPGRIFEVPGGPGETPLTRWKALLGSEGTGTSSADALWSSLLQSLAGTRSEIGDRLVAKVRPVGSTRAAAVPAAEFMADVDRPDGQTAPQWFNPAVLTDDARMRVSSAVELNRGTSTRLGLGCVAVLTQLSEGLPDYEYAAGAPVHSGPGDGPRFGEPASPGSDTCVEPAFDF